MSNITFTIGEIEEAISIISEAAKWLIDTGKPMWKLEDIKAEKLGNAPEEFLILKVNGIGVAAMTLSFYDPFFWPNIEKGKSGFIHKLSIRRDFAGKGYAEKLIEYAGKLCLKKGVHYLRLDCDPNRHGLCNFYQKVGFVCKEIKKFQIKTLGEIDCAMYEMKF